MPLLLEQEEQDSEQRLALFSKGLKLPAFQNFSRPGHIQLLRKEASTLPLEICIKMIGDGTLMIQLKEATGWATRMRSTTCVNKHLKLSFN
jgi:hypothetical protein